MKSAGATTRSNQVRGSKALDQGTTLIELMVALGVFLIISSAAVMLVRKHVALYPTQQGQAELNIQLRTALSQMQNDLMNAGADYNPVAEAPGSPLGVTIQNNSGTNCYSKTTGIYSQACFDSFAVLAFDSAAKGHPDGSYDLTSFSTMSIIPDGVSASQLAAAYKNGTELLLVTGAVSSVPEFMTVTLTADATYSSTTGKVSIQFTPVTSVTVTNPVDGTYPGYYNSKEAVAYSVANNPPCGPAAITTAQFDTTSRILKLNPIVYSVDATTDPRNPTLIRTANGKSAVLVNTLVGFKVGAMTWGVPLNATSDEDMFTYYYNPCEYYHPNNFSLIRSVKISLIGRTANDPTSSFVNAFDSGHYRVQAVSMIANPRNLSMRDQ